MSTAAVLTVKYTPLRPRGGLRQNVGKFLRYIQHRDHHFGEQQVRDVEGFVRYAAFRDAADPQGRLFDAVGTAGREQRMALTQYIARSAEGLQPRWMTDARGEVHDTRRLVYRFVLSPADARGLDLRAAARAALERLEELAGGRLGPWIAAEHRNTAHPHVHVVVPARRELEDGRFREVRITRERLRAMKEAVSQEIEQQRAARAVAHQELVEELAPHAERQPRREGNAVERGFEVAGERAATSEAGARRRAPHRSETTGDVLALPATRTAAARRSAAGRGKADAPSGQRRRSGGTAVVALATSAAVIGRYARAAEQDMEERRRRSEREAEELER